MSWIAAGPAAPDPASPTRRVAVGDGRGVLLVHLDDGWYALDDRCTHAGCPLDSDGEVEGDTLICDCHGSEFDIRTGEVRQGPARLPLGTHAVRSTGTELEVEVEG